IVSVRKSPNIISTTGRKPVMAAPTPTPVKPASEMGVSITRSAPNSSTSPDNTLNGVPASATSSPKMQTRESLRISSASASRTACAKVNSRSRASGINVLLHFVDSWVRRRQSKIHCRFHLRAHLGLNALKCGGVRKFFGHQRSREILDWIALGLPLVLFSFRAVILAVDVAHVVSREAIRIAQKK